MTGDDDVGADAGGGGRVSLAAVVLVELRAAAPPRRRHAAVATHTRLAHPVAPGTVTRLHRRPHDQHGD